MQSSALGPGCSSYVGKLSIGGAWACVEKGGTMGFKVILAPKGDWILTFILDHDRNLFEIKAIPQ